MCAGGVAGAGVCQGDDGGPLTIPMGNANQHTLVGVTSFTNGCGQVSNFRDLNP